ncbi:glutamine--fructose-6-phosphate transaminase (isomerizing) [Biomphalaria pfeifferi]|uniref:Glutamine--fructose-6-phosphate transaminase (Isomerizing) n=1 Tax=Biomphalaria pfeifferi TaxID=112525 RepID=A0AAD8ANU8_BIOPF|nr:glutamine--fructose-6-phosphate transaminase (isomerizing) [Biomphalaria pfeifferi]
MKHGPNALIDEKLPVVIVNTREKEMKRRNFVTKKTHSNIDEVKSRDGHHSFDSDRRRRDELGRFRSHHRSSRNQRSACADSFDRSFAVTSPTTSPSAAAATLTSRATWQNQSLWNSFTAKNKKRTA